MTISIQDLLSLGEPVLLDGAMGTLLMNAGIEKGASGESWNVTHPEKIQTIHREYIQAGSQIILTNTFGGTSIRSKSNNVNEVFENNKKAAENAKTEADKATHPVYVAGSMGPTGSLMKPYGLMSYEEAVETFAEQSKALEKGGVDLFWIETMSDLNEVKAAIEGIRQHSQLPIAVTMTFDTNGHTMMGLHPTKAVEELNKLNLIAFGTNCGNGPEEMETVIKIMVDAGANAPLIIKSNAGLPYMDGDIVKYDGTPEVMAAHAKNVLELGAILIGGCCGTTPVHIKAMAESIK